MNPSICHTFINKGKGKVVPVLFA